MFDQALLPFNNRLTWFATPSSARYKGAKKRQSTSLMISGVSRCSLTSQSMACLPYGLFDGIFWDFQ